MSDHQPPADSPPPVGSVRRRRLSLSGADLVNESPLASGQELPLVFTPVLKDVDLVDWASSSRELLDARLRRYGALLFRGFSVASVDRFHQFMNATSHGELLEYSYASTPRSIVSGRIYTSTEYPADRSIPLHNEMSYSRNWPLKIWFYCETPAERGGETPLADSRKVLGRIPPGVRARFEEKRVAYVRNYGGDLDLPWRSVFRTSNKAEVDAFCESAGIECEWGPGDRLRTRQVCQGAARHPVTGEQVWFNQAHLFHVSSLEPEERRLLLEAREEQDLPRNAYYGDGSAIAPDDLDKIRDAYRQQAITFPWQQGDILMLDNMLTAHGRMPYHGARRVLVGMAESFSDASS